MRQGWSIILHNTDYQFHHYSKTTEYEYTIQVYVPNVESPKEGFPVIYVLDGLSYFEIAKHAIKLQSQSAPKTKIEPSIVVAIGHDQSNMRQRRFLDFTAHAEQYVFPERAKGKLMHVEKYGGATLFREFIEHELKPIIEKRFKVNTNNQTLYGHSLAGYYTIWCYLNHCLDFQTYLAISPSIWWNEKELFNYLKQANLQNLQRLYIAVGEHEGFMVEDATAFYKEIPALSKRLFVALEENHASVVPTTISQSFRFIFEK